MIFEDLKRINAELNSMNIKGKSYIPVNERVKAFRMLYPEGQIVTDLVKAEDGIVIVKASIGDGLGKILTTGYAQEVEGSSNINRTSALENCETSAVGRALGFLGIGIDTSIASYEEVTNAKLREDGLKLATSTEKAGLIASANAKGMDVETILKKVGFDRNRQPEGMNVEQYAKAMEIINKGGDNA